jgi:hypothetical protein
MPCLLLDGFGACEGAAGEQRNVYPVSRIAHRSVTDDFDFGCTSSVG